MRLQSWKKLALITVACAAFGLPAVSAQDAMPEPQACGAPEVTDISLGFGIDAVFAPHILGIEKGWFEEAGFTSVDTPTFTAGALAGEALAAGEIELWTPGNVPPISMIHNGLPVVVVGINTDAYIERLVVRSDAGLEAPEDLYDIRIGLLEGSTASAVLAKIAEQYELDVNQLQVVNLPPPEQMTSIINNDIQAFIAWNPWPYLALEDAELDVEVMHSGTVASFPWDDSEFQTSNTLSLFVMGENFVSESPNAACAIMQVLLRGQEYARDPENREEVVALLAEWNNQPVELVDQMWDDYSFDPTFGEDYLRDMQAYTDFLFDAGRIDDQIDPLEYTNTALVAGYNPAYIETEGNWTP